MNDFYRSKPTVVRAKIFDPDKMDEMNEFVDGAIEETMFPGGTAPVYVINSPGRNIMFVNKGDVIVLDTGIIRVYDIEIFHKLYESV